MWILILVFLSGANSRPYTVMQEFSSEATCQVAINQVRGAYQRDSNTNQLLQSVCVKK